MKFGANISSIERIGSCRRPHSFDLHEILQAHAVTVDAAIDEIRKRGDSCGGEVTCVVRNPPTGLGSPVFDKLEAELAKVCMSLPASKV